MTKFKDAQGDCTHGGIKIEVLVDGTVDETQTQYICNGQTGQSGTSFTTKTTKFDDSQGGCTNGGIKIEILVDGKVDDTQTQYICNGGQGGVFCSGIFYDSRNDSANCGGCGNVCEPGSECVNSTCTPIADLSTSTLICNGQTVAAYEDLQNCGGCGNTCAQGYKCIEGSCIIKIGSIIPFGHYEQDYDTTNGKEPIEWRVLDKNAEGQILVISEKLLEGRRYHEDDTNITWEKSTIRSWLNGYAASYNTCAADYTSDNFINTAFTTEEIAKIISTHVPAHANPKYSSDPGNATTDKIFLLSSTEAKAYFTDDASRKANPTHNVVKNGFYVYAPEANIYSKDGSCAEPHCLLAWALRTPGAIMRRSSYVGTNGVVDNYGEFVINRSLGMRPAMWLNY